MRAHFSRPAFFEGVRDMTPVLIGIVPFGMVCGIAAISYRTSSRNASICCSGNSWGLSGADSLKQCRQRRLHRPVISMLTFCGTLE